jgi:hypothetical protein
MIFRTNFGIVLKVQDLFLFSFYNLNLYVSTKHHQHFRLNNPDLTEGMIFYVVIKTTSKANVEGIQVH